jgi:hypothetical protein
MLTLAGRMVTDIIALSLEDVRIESIGRCHVMSREVTRDAWSKGRVQVQL